MINGRLSVELVESGVDPADLDRDTRLLRNDLLELDVTSVDLPTCPSPTGAKSGVGATVATLVVALAGSSVLTAVVNAVATWVPRGHRRRVTFTMGDMSLEMTSASPEEQARIIAAFLATLEQGRSGDGS